MCKCAVMRRERTITFIHVVMAATAPLLIMILLLLLPNTTSTYSYGQDKIIINGAGATFPLPLIDTWREKFQVVDPELM